MRAGRRGPARSRRGACGERPPKRRARAYERDDGALEVPGEAVTDPVAYTLALAAAAERHGAKLRTRATRRIDRGRRARDFEAAHRRARRSVRCRVAVNCAGLEADSVARLAGDDSFSIYPRKGEFLVFDPPARRAARPDPAAGADASAPRACWCSRRSTARSWPGPTAVDLEDKRDWSVRPDGARRRSSPRRPRCIRRSSTPSPCSRTPGCARPAAASNYVIGPVAGRVRGSSTSPRSARPG